MPPFFFDTIVNGESKSDRDGTDLPSLDAVQGEAGRCAGEMVHCTSVTEVPEQWAMNVRDEDGHSLTTLIFQVRQFEAA